MPSKTFTFCIFLACEKNKRQSQTTQIWNLAKKHVYSVLEFKKKLKIKKKPKTVEKLFADEISTKKTQKILA